MIKFSDKININRKSHIYNKWIFFLELLTDNSGDLVSIRRRFGQRRIRLLILLIRSHFIVLWLAVHDSHCALIGLFAGLTLRYDWLRHTAALDIPVWKCKQSTCDKEQNSFGVIVWGLSVLRVLP